MTDFTITEDIPKNEIEFDEQISNPTNRYDYLFKKIAEWLHLQEIWPYDLVFRR